MTFDLDQILASKSSFRQELAARDILDKLAMLDALRERALTLRGHRFPSGVSDTSALLREDPAPYRTRPD